MIRRQKYKRIVDSRGAIRSKEHGNKKYRNHNDQYEVRTFHFSRQEKCQADHSNQNQINDTQIDKRPLQKCERIRDGSTVDLQRKVPAIRPKCHKRDTKCDENMERKRQYAKYERSNDFSRGQLGLAILAGQNDCICASLIFTAFCDAQWPAMRL